MEEIWKDIKGFEGRYLISNHGRVKSMYFQKSKNKKEYICNQKCNKKGYLRVSLPNVGSCYIHRLVAAAFIGDVSNLTVNHKDFNKENNHVSNLEIITSEQNSLHYILGNKEKGLYTSKLMGVGFFKATNKWRARIREGDKDKHIGFFKTEQEAHEAYVNYNKQNNIQNTVI